MSKTLDGPPLPRKGWIRIQASDRRSLEAIWRQHGVSLDRPPTHAIDEAGFHLLPVVFPLRDDQPSAGTSFRINSVLIAFNSELLITVEPDQQLEPLNEAQARASRLPGPASTHEVLVLTIEALNDTLQESVAWISLVLNDLADDAVDSSGGFKIEGRQVGVADIAQTAVSLGEAEELIARTVAGQLMLERAVRWIPRSTVDRSVLGTDKREAALLSDIQGGRRHARFQHSRVRNIQQSLMTTLDLKQNQIIKVFTVVTAVFTPPTLIASYYGQNFARMPELSLVWGEWFVMAATAFFALAPLAYIKRKGWMR